MDKQLYDKLGAIFDAQPMEWYSDISLTPEQKEKERVKMVDYFEKICVENGTTSIEWENELMRELDLRHAKI